MTKRRDGARGDGTGEAAGAAEQREADELVQWLGESLELPDPGDPGNAPYFDWLARDLRGRQRAPERAEAEERAARFAARMSAALGGKARVASLAGAPTGRRPSVAGTVQGAIDAAARERSAVVVGHAVAAGIGRELWDEPAERWVELPADVPDGQYVVLTVAGDSMLPVLHDGDAVLVKVGPELVRQSIVVARRPDDGYVVKRVGAVTARDVELTSFNPAYPPVRIPRDERLVVGTVVLRWCGHEPAH